MGDEVGGSLEGKSLSNLRVVDLKMELEKRGLSKSGSKKELIKRLKQKLELEKLYEESSSIGDSEPKLHLDEATEQNEFVKQYLAEQQKIYARQKEVRRLIELREQQEEKDDSDSELKDQDSDVSESLNVSKNSCDSSTHAEVDNDDEVRKFASEENEQDTSVKVQEPESSSQEEPCESSDIVQTTHGEAEAAVTPQDMESKSREAVAFSLSDISLPQSPKKLHGHSESKLHSSSSERSSHRRSSGSHKTKSSTSPRKEEFKANGTSLENEISNSKTSELSHDSNKKPSNTTEDISDRTDELSENLVQSSKEASKSDHDTVTDQNIDSSVDHHHGSSQNEHESLQKSKEERSPKVSSNECEEFSKKTKVEVNSHIADDDCSEERNIADSSTQKETCNEQEMGTTDSMTTQGKSSPSEQKVEKMQTVEEEEEEEEGLVKSDDDERETVSSIKTPESRNLGIKESDKVPSKKKRRKSNRDSSTSSSSSSSSSSSDSSSPERKTYQKRKSEVKRSVARHSPSDKSMSDSSSDSDHRKSKRVKPSRRESQDKKSSHLQEKVKSEEKAVVSKSSLQQPKRPRINRSSFQWLERYAQGYDRYEKDVPSSSRKHKEVSISNHSEATVASTESKSQKQEELKKPPQVSPSKRNSVPEVPPEKISYRKLKVPFKRNEEKKSEDQEKSSEKKRRWRSSGSSVIPKSAMSISTDSLKSLIPDFKMVCGPSLANESEEVITKVAVVEKEKGKFKEDVSEDSRNLSSSFLNELESKKRVRRPTIEETNEEPMEVDKEVDIPSVEPSHKPISTIIFIQNLVRPFTLMQLKDLLNQTGTVVKDGFWIDKIKSKCIVKYENEEQASKTREALHGTRWPPSNPKILSVDFASQEEFDLHNNAVDIPKPPVPTSSQHGVPKEEEHHESMESHKRKERTEQRSRERDRDRPKHAMARMREWDKDKLSQDSPERGADPIIKEHERSTERKKEKKESKKKEVEDTPAKLLDDLFQKTKTTPCIYWLPLTEEQVKLREDELRQRRLDREKRNQQQREQDAERRAKRRPREKENRSRSRSHTGRRR